MRAEHKGARRPSALPNFDDCLSADQPRLRRMARDLARGVQVAPAKRGSAGSQVGAGQARAQEALRVPERGVGGAPGAAEAQPGRDRVEPRAARLQADFDALLARSRAAFAARRAALPVPDFPPELPVSARRDEIAAAFVAHQVIIVCGETGSGKTTQLPKIAMTLGRGVAGLIGHTQPRRLAARATASRIAQEPKSPLGQAVGYKIRFTDKTSERSHIKLMTDGILLAETQTDPLLAAYDTLIIDEAHERSLNIDFLLGYLRTLLPRRPDLKVIVTSATLDAERFARHFADAAGKPAPVIEVSGRLYPIEMRYRPVESEDVDPAAAARAAAKGGKEGEKSKAGGRDKGRDLMDALVDAVDEAQRCGPGDVLVFLPGEREIREAAEALRKAHHLPGTEVLSLFARQSAQDQARVFSPSNGRRVVLSTNVAETSLTVPGVRYVVDTGLARIKRYSPRTKVEQLQVEKIAQSAAQQRAGRCGRVMDGICIRLYDEDDFNRRQPHTDPEILRSSLAGVILRMKALKLGAVEDFPFIDAPDSTLRPEGFGSEVRRARLGVQGDMPGGFGYKFEVDFAGNEVALTDAILTYGRGPATVTVGQHNNFQGLEELTSSLHSSFIERAAFTDAFGFERRLGLSVQYAKGPFLAQAGVFSDNVDALSNKNRGADGRIVFMPKSGDTQFHVGGSVHYADLEALSTVRYRQRPLVAFTDERFINTGAELAGGTPEEFSGKIKSDIAKFKHHLVSQSSRFGN